METDKTIHKMYEIRPTEGASRTRGGVFGKGRYLLGRTESCDVIINHDSISAVHAVLEIFETHALIYDMASTNGTYVNDEKIVVKEIRIGDKFRLANSEFEFKHYEIGSALPPVLDSLEPEHGRASVKSPPSLPLETWEPKKLPAAAPAVSVLVPSIVYPLAADPRAEFSEYIFEDRDEIYPIFNYEPSKISVEVLILFKDQVFSVDFLPEGPHSYAITGLQDTKLEVEFPYFSPKEKIPFIDVRGGQTIVQTLPGFSVFYLSDNKKDTGHQGASIKLSGNDLVRLHKGDIQIFVRNVAAPPKVAHAPVMKRDSEFQKYLFFFFFITFIVTVGLNVVELPEDLKKEELAPERLATILYRQESIITPKVVNVEKPKLPPKKPQPPKMQTDVPKPKEPQPIVKNPDVIETKDQTKKPDPGKPKEPLKRIVKQGTEPIKKPTNIVTASIPKSDSSSKSLSTKGPTAYAQVQAKSLGHVEVYKSADFASTVSSVVAKGGSLSGVRTNNASGNGGGNSLGGGVATGVSTGTGNVKTAGIPTNQGSLVGATVGVLGESKGAGGLSAKKAIYTAGIPSETVVLGSMDPDVIRRILLDHLPQFRYCYQKELEKLGQEMSGVIKLDFSIGASGHVTQAGVDSSSGLPTEVKKCVIGVLKGISFPEPMGGGTVEVKQPMNFYPKKI